MTIERSRNAQQEPWVGAAMAGAGWAMAGRARAQEGEGEDRSSRIKLGFDILCVRSWRWKAPALLAYAAAQQVDMLMFSGLGAMERLEASYLQALRAQAEAAGIELQIGTGSICPGSRLFNPQAGTAEDQLSQAIQVAGWLGARVIRCVLGSYEDRLSPEGISSRVREVVEALKNCRSRALDAGVKIAVENHAGDLRASELAGLIEEAGRDFVGASVDAGNAVLSLEDPLDHLEVLGPYAITTGIRDSAIWEVREGAAVQWTALGQGQVDFRAYVRRFAQLCPEAVFCVRTVSGVNLNLPYLVPSYWKAYPAVPARDLMRFIRLARQGQPREPWAPPAMFDAELAEKEYQKLELERSLAYGREVLGLGRKAVAR